MPKKSIPVESTTEQLAENLANAVFDDPAGTPIENPEENFAAEPGDEPAKYQTDPEMDESLAGTGDVPP